MRDRVPQLMAGIRARASAWQVIEQAIAKREMLNRK